MAWATRCDRCGVYFEYHEETNGFAFLLHNRSGASYSISGDGYDLCPKCVNFLKNWIEERKEEQF